MVELFQDLLPWLVAFYLFDGVVSVRRGQVMIASSWPGRYQVYGRGLWLSSLAPGAEVYCAADAPLVPGARALHVLNGSENYHAVMLGPLDVDALPWPPPADIIRDRTSVLVGGRPVWVAPSEEQAEVLTAQLRALAVAPEEKRAVAVSELASSRFDRNAIVALERELRPHLLGLRVASVLVFLGWFVALPAICFGPLDALRWLVPTLLFLLVLHLEVLVLAWITLKRAGLRSQSLTALLPVALFPPSGARALAHVTRMLYSAQEGCALALALLPAQRKASLLRRRVHRALLEREAFAGHDAAPWFVAAARALDRVRLEDPPQFRPPTPLGADAALFCPICEAQYRKGFDACSGCGVALQSLKREKPRKRAR